MKVARSLMNLLILFMPFLIVSCEHKDIECPGSQEINVSFDWENATDADVDGMTLFFYPLEENGHIWRFDIAGKDGGCVELPSGTYELITCNNDLSGIRFDDTGSPSTIYASARRLDTGDEIDVYANSGMLYCGIINRLEVTPCGVRYISNSGELRECSRRVVRCRPDSVSTLYNLRFINVTGLESVRSAVVELEGVRSSILLESGCTSDIPVALSINMDISPSDATFSGSACAFAPCDLRSVSYRPKLKIVRMDGKAFARNIDVRPEDMNVIARHCVLITIRNMVIPDEGSPGDIGGIGAVVDGWEVIEIDLSPTF